MTLPTVTTPINKLVNREEQLEEFRQVLDRIRILGSVYQTLYEWYGGPGIGKTTLSRLLRDICDKSGVPFTSIDFAEHNPRARLYQEDISLLVEDLVSNFRVLKLEIDDERDTIMQFRKAGTSDRATALANLSRAFQRLVSKLTENTPAVLFFDETEKADQDQVVAWLEEWIINPLSQTGRCLIVWTGRRPQRWKRFEVRRRARVKELGVFEEKDTKELFQKNSVYPLGDLAIPIRKLTGGHPYADTIVLRYLDGMCRKGQEPNKEHPDRLENNILDALTQEFVDSFAFKGLEPETINACRVMSLVRQFDVIMLREILTQTLSEKFGSYGRNEFGGLLSRLRSTELVLWDDRRKGYAIDPTLRHIVGEYIWRKQPKLYAKANQVAITVYRDWIERAGDNRGIYVVEELYQQACLNRLSDNLAAKEKRELEGVLRQRISEYHQQDIDLRVSALDRLYHELVDDPDLQRLLDARQRECLIELAHDARAGQYHE